LPRFPNEFETKVMLSSNGLNVSSDVVILFDTYRQRGELIISENGNTLRRIYYFEQDEVKDFLSSLIIILMLHRNYF
jgi:hypothetical protein